MLKFIKENLLFLLGLIFIVFFFYKVFLYGLLPIPTDNIVGIYHPYRDLYSAQYPRGIPFENSLVTDPIRQQYLWKELAVSQFKEGQLPLWNPYNFSGYPLLANFQSGVFYPINLAMFILPFEYGWTVLIMSQPILGFIFMFFYLRNLKVSKLSSMIGSIAFSFSGFFVSWMEWGNIVSTALWLPLILLSIDKIFSYKDKILRVSNYWLWILLISLVSSFFAGYLQTFFYLSLVVVGYILFRIFEDKKRLKRLPVIIILSTLFLIVTSIQSIPTLQFITLSARSVDQVSTDIEGWFIPWQNLIQFIAPDFFGNPATLNYWGVWNYGEFIGYIGILPLILALSSLFFVRTKTAMFYKIILLAGIIFAFPSIVSNIPFLLNIPFISSSQPTRLIFIIDFALVVLSAFGFDYLREKRKKIFAPLSILALTILTLWIYVKANDMFPQFMRESADSLLVSYSNLRLPTLIFISTAILFAIEIFLIKRTKSKIYPNILIFLITIIFLFDIFRFADKYMVFSEKEYLYPPTESLNYLVNQDIYYRVMETDSRILPPNFSISYGIQSIDGYDPLYLMRYGELVAAISRNRPDINPPFGFNRIITPQNYQHNFDAFNVGYLLSLTDINDENFEKVFEEGETKIYKKNQSTQRAFFVEQTIGAKDKNDAIQKYFEQSENLNSVAIVEDENYVNFDREWTQGLVSIVDYSPNKIVLKVENEGEGFLVLSDSFYPTWRVSIDGRESEIYRTNYNFRGVIVPQGSVEIVFTNHLF